MAFIGVGRITNSDYRRLNSVDVALATRELRQLVEAGLAVQQSTKRWAYYTPGEKLRPKAEIPAPPPVEPRTDEEKILAYVREHGAITRRECRRLLNLSVSRASYLLETMRDKKALAMVGERKAARYVLP